MKKILIFSLCTLFSFSSTLYGTDVAALRSNVLWNFSVPVHLRADEMLVPPIVCDIDKERDVKSIKLNVLATFGKDLKLCCYASTYLLVNLVTGFIQQLHECVAIAVSDLHKKWEAYVSGIANKHSGVEIGSKTAEAQPVQYFFASEKQEACDLDNLSASLKKKRWEAYVSGIANKHSGVEIGSKTAEAQPVQYFFASEKQDIYDVDNLSASLKKIGITISRCEGESADQEEVKYKMTLDGNLYLSALDKMEPALSGSVEIPVERVGRIRGSSTDVDIYRYKNMCKVSQEDGVELYGEDAYFLLAGGKLQELDSGVGPVAVAVAKQPLEGKFCVDDICKTLGEQKGCVLRRKVVSRSVRRLSVRLVEYGEEIVGIGSKSRGYTIREAIKEKELELVNGGRWSRQVGKEDWMEYFIEKDGVKVEIGPQLGRLVYFLAKAERLVSIQKIAEQILCYSPVKSKSPNAQVETVISGWGKTITRFGLDFVRVEEFGKNQEVIRGYRMEAIGKEGAGKKRRGRPKKALKEPVAEPSLLHAEPKETLEGPSSKRGRFDDKASQAHDNVHVELRPQAPNPGQDDRQSVNMPLENFGNGQPEPQGQQQDMALGNFGNTQPVPQMQQWNQAQIPFQQGPMMSQLDDQPQQYQNPERTDILYVHTPLETSEDHQELSASDLGNCDGAAFEGNTEESQATVKQDEGQQGRCIGREWFSDDDFDFNSSNPYTSEANEDLRALLGDDVWQHYLEELI